MPLGKAAFKTGALEILKAAGRAALPIIFFEGLISIYWFGQTRRFAIATHRLAFEFYWLLLANLLWIIWRETHPQSAVRIRNTFSWMTITSWMKTHRAVAFASLGIVLTVYSSSFLTPALTAESSTIRAVANWINEHVLTFTLIGKQIKAESVLAIEAVGFIVAALAGIVYSSAVPPVLGRAVQNYQLSLAETIRGVGSNFPIRDLYLTLKDFCKDEAKKPIAFNWENAHEQLERLKQEITTDRLAAIQTAATIVDISPADEPAYYALGKALFGVVKPSIRWLLMTMLTAALLLTSFPVFVRVLVFLVPALEKDIRTWQIW